VFASLVWQYHKIEKKIRKKAPHYRVYTKIQQGVCHTVALPFYIKKNLKAKEELWKFKYFTMQKCNLKKKFL
jgi:hypothetical protein